ncbi:MAG: hypothetical protein OHK0029_37510 [Armatimonadaceae bacterium]
MAKQKREKPTSSPAVLDICWTRKRDGSITFQCTRPDGSATWQRHDTPFFVYHDLTHYAVETILRLRWAFYGILLSGWDIADFGAPWPRGPIPANAAPDAALAEGVAGVLDVERGCRVRLSAEEFNVTLAEEFARGGIPQPCLVTEEQLTEIRGEIAHLTANWLEVPMDGSMRLRFVQPD